MWPGNGPSCTRGFGIEKKEEKASHSPGGYPAVRLRRRALWQSLVI